MSEPRPISEAIAAIRERAADPVHQAAIDARLAEAESERERERARSIEAEWAHAGVPRRLFPMLAAPDETEAVRAVQTWFSGSKTFLVLGGGVGVGKTVGAALAVSLARRGRELEPGLWLRGEPALFRKARDIATLSQFNADAWAELYDAPLLAIDDLGAEALDEKGWALSALLGLLDRRYDAAAKTVITTNLGVDGVRARYGQDGGRLFDRLREAGEWVEIGGESMRKANGGRP